MSLIGKKVTPKMVAANRRNSLQSTGPRTREGKRRASLNSLKHGAYAQPDSEMREAMEKLGEDPREYERLHQELMAAWQPFNAVEGMLVGDLADLYWTKRRAQRTQTELQARATWVAEPEKELLPVTQRWSLMLNQDAALDRQIEAKIKLLLWLKASRRTRAKQSKSRVRQQTDCATRRRVLRVPSGRMFRRSEATEGGRPPLSRRARRRMAEVNEGKKHDISNKETKPLSGAESTT